MPTSPLPHAIIFDVNETLIDLEPLRKLVNKRLDNPGGFRQWFGLMLQHSQVATLTSNYFTFSAIGDAALDMAADMLQTKRLTPEQRHEVAQKFTELPAHPDVAEGLARFRDAGIQLLTLTNSTPSDLQKQLASAGLSEYFAHALSVDPVRLYKPHPEPYRYATQQAGVAPAHALMVAAHGWDVAGALAAGLQAAFLARPGQAVYPMAPPTYQAPTLTALADQLLS